MSISCGQNFTVTIDDSGCVWWFGAVRNNHDSLPSCTRIPVELNTNGVKIKCVASWQDLILFVGEDGSAYFQGMLGSFAYNPFNQFVALSNIVQVDCGKDHGVFLDSHGVCYGIGRNVKNCLVSKGESLYMQPVILEGLENITQVSCGVENSIFLNSDGQVFGRGANGFKQLSTKAPNEFGLVHIEFPEFIHFISFGGFHLLALSDSGNVWGLGSCNNAQLGTGESTGFQGIPSKAKFEEENFILAIAAGQSHSLAVDVENNLWIFGKSYFHDKVFSTPRKLTEVENVQTLPRRGIYGFLVKADDNIHVFSNKEFEDKFGPRAKINSKLPNKWSSHNNVIGTNIYWRRSSKKSARK